jgi:hypothetical protein
MANLVLIDGTQILTPIQTKFDDASKNRKKMNCQNGSCSLRRNNSSSGLFGQAQPFMNLNGAAFQKFGNGSFNRLQGFNPQMFSNMRFQ